MLKKGFRLIFFGWMIFITALSLFSLDSLDLDTGEMKVPHADKLAHFTFYFVASILGCLAVRESTNGAWSLRITNRIVLFFCVLYGTIIEVLQMSFTRDREGDFFDALANSMGASLGVAVIYFLFSGKSRIKWKI